MMTDEAKNFLLLNMVGEIEDYAILLLDTEGNIENWNKGAEKIKGYKAEEAIGNSFRMFYGEEDRLKGKPDMLLNRARIEGKAFDEGWRVRKDGSRFWGSVLITPIRDPERTIIGFTKVTRDLTDKMLAAQALEQHLNELKLKNKELEQFVYIASHDLQEPLLTVSNFIDLLKTEYAHVHDDDAQMYIDFIQEASERMRNLIKDLLDHSRIGKSRGTEMVNVNALLSEVIHDLDSLIIASGARLHIDDMPIIKAYPTELRQLFQNLITNAVKFTRRGVAPEITIKAEPFSMGWRFFVADNGIGIDIKHKDKIFLIFQRLNNRDEYPGNGIGLAHCKKIAVMHNGEIEVDSVPDQGSTFSFTVAL